MKNLGFCLLSPLLIIFTAHANEEGLVISDHWHRDYYPHGASPPVDFTTRASHEVAQQDLQYTVPLRFSDDGNAVTFSSINLNHRSTGERSFSGGLGARFLMPGLNAVMGARLHGDVMDTRADNQVGQFSLGFDFYTRQGIDITANLYLASDDMEHVGSFTSFDDPFARRNSILQTQNFLQIYEQGRSGGDIQVEFDLPWLSENFIPARGKVGAYHYEGDFRDDVSGAMAGLTLHPFRGVRAGVEYYGDEDFFGDHWVFMAAVSMPLETALDPRSWGRGLANAFSRRPDTYQPGGTEYLRSRMVSPVQRRNWVLTETSDPILVDAIDRTVLSNVVFVNSGAAVGNGIMRGSSNGKARKPMKTIQEGTAKLASMGGRGTVYVQGGGGRKYDSILDRDIEVGHGAGAGVKNIRLTSSSIPIHGFGGRQFGGNTRNAVVPNGGFDIRGGANGSTRKAVVEGFTIRGGISNDPPGTAMPGTGISSLDVMDFTAHSNMIDKVAGQGIAVSNDSGVVSTMITGNRITRVGEDGIRLFYDDDVTKSTVLVGNNILQDVGEQGIDLDIDSDGGERYVHDVSIVGNKFRDVDDDGIEIDVNINEGSFSLLVGNNIFRDMGNNGIDLDLDHDGGEHEVSIVDNQFRDVDDDGIEMDTDSSGGALSLLVGNNIFRNIGDTGLEIDSNSDSGAKLDMSVVGNKLRSVGDDGIDLEIDSDTGWVNLTVVGNDILNVAGGDGMVVDVGVSDGATAMVNIANNRLVNVEDDGIEFQFDVDDGSTGTARVANNYVNGTRTGEGLEIDYGNSGNSNSSLNIVDNQFLNIGSHGVEIDTDFDQSGPARLVFANNRIVDAANDGLNLNLDAENMNAAPTVVVSGNRFLGSGNSSFYLSVDSDMNAAFSGGGNISRNAGSGFSFEDGGTTDAAGSIEINGTTINFPSPGDVAE